MTMSTAFLSNLMHNLGEEVETACNWMNLAFSVMRDGDRVVGAFDFGRESLSSTGEGIQVEIG